MDNSCFNRNFWVMTGTFVAIVLVTLVGLYFAINQAGGAGLM